MVKKIIGNKEYEIVQKNLPIRALKFYIDNPRVYSMFDRSEHEPSQEEMEEAMCNMDDVKELRGNIEKTGGILTPIIVKDGDMIVIEGNRRLAAYKMLANKDPIKWSTVPCDVYPADLDDDAIFRILGICHLNGQKKWAPFEEASLIYRRAKSTGQDFGEIAENVSRPKGEIKKYYEVYELMVMCDDLNSEHWSYYEEYSKNNGLKKLRKRLPGLDAAVSNMIKSGILTDAKSDIREKLGQIAKMPESKAIEILNQVISQEKTLDEAYSEIENLNVDIYHSIHLFRAKIMDPSTKKTLDNLSLNESVKYIADLKMIQSTISQILQKLDKNPYSYNVLNRSQKEEEQNPPSKNTE